MANDLRFNYSRTNCLRSSHLDTFGGAVPLATLPFPTPYTGQNASFGLFIFSLINDDLFVGKNANQLQHQINIVDNLSSQTVSHSLKFGFDFRRLSPDYN